MPNSPAFADWKAAAIATAATAAKVENVALSLLPNGHDDLRFCAVLPLNWNQ